MVSLKFSALASMVLVAFATFVPLASAFHIIGHRGLFHDVDNRLALAENTVGAMLRAANLGMYGVELDVRAASDGVLMVTHDIISNRNTVVDGAEGNLNPIDVALNQQASEPLTYISSRPGRSWSGTELKVYGRAGTIIASPNQGVQRMETLEAMLVHLKNFNKPTFRVFLDIQDPHILKAAAGLVKTHGLANQVILKFFAVKAIDPAFKETFVGGDTCWRYALNNNLYGVQIVPQFNDGELTFVHNAGYVKVFGTTLSITQYLDCWRDAQRAHQGAGAALVPFVAASVPANNHLATNAAIDAMNWAKNNGRQRIAIVPNPDAGRRISGKCQMWTFQSNKIPAVGFDHSARAAKFAFANAHADYAIIDVMGNMALRGFSAEYNAFETELC